MSFALTDEQTLLVEMARRFADRAPTQAPEWTQIAELGWPALCIPEQYDGLAMGLFDLCLIQEQLGRTLRLDPVLSNALASDLLARAGTKEQQAHWLPAIAAGDKRLTVALSGPRSAAALVGRHASGWTLEAARDQVWDAQGADGIIVPTEEGLFLVEREAPGVTLTPQSRIDGRPVCRVVFRAVEVAKSGRLDGGNGALEIALDRATIALSAEMLGGAQRAFDDTLEYLRTRVQFGKTLGSFQALQHRAARLYGELAVARSAVRGAALAADDGSMPLQQAASLCKVTLNKTYRHVANEAIQLHGGIGMTSEHHIGSYLKHCRAAMVTFGDSAHHRARWATARGY